MSKFFHELFNPPMRNAERNQAMGELPDLHFATTASANPVDVISTERRTVKPWFQGKLPFTFNLPELQDSTYKLLGDKLVYFEHAPGAQLIYELHKHELLVFIVRDSPHNLPMPDKVITRSDKGFSVETWKYSGLRYLVVSDASPADVHNLAEMLRSAAR